MTHTFIARTWSGSRRTWPYTAVFLTALSPACERHTLTPNLDSSSHDVSSSSAPAPGAGASSGVEAGVVDDAGRNSGESPQTEDAGGSSIADAGMVTHPSTTPDAEVLDAASAPLVPGAPIVGSTPEELALDVFETFQNRYWFIATPEQVDAINEEFQGRGGGWGGGWNGGYGDMYAPNSGGVGKNTIDHLLVTTPEGKTADFGEMQVKLVGQSTGRPWTADTLPNFKIDADDVTPGLRLGGYEHLRFNNGVRGSIYKEKFVYELYRALGYPAPLATYGWVSSTVWEPDVEVPYIVVESYKRGFCRNRQDYFGVECPNMWEFAQDLGYGVFEVPDNCQFESCESTRASEFEQVVMAAQAGEASLEEVGEYLDWERFHEFQCLSWMFGTTDDAIHASNNTVWVERQDGKFQLLPYSIDISFESWGAELAGYTSVPSLCQNDEGCWADTIATCERLLQAFEQADPVGRIDQLHEQIEAAGMLRSGDVQRYRDLRSTLERLLTQLPEDLERYRDDPWGGGSQYCQYPLAWCDGYCELPQFCPLCQDQGEPDGDAGVYPPKPEPRPADSGFQADVALPVPVPPVPVPTTTAPNDVDGGVPAPGEKPDFCYWDVGWYGVK